MEENSKTFFGSKKPGRGARRPYRVDAAALESKGFRTIRYDRHESYAKAYALEGRVFVGTVNPVTGDRTVNKAGAFASAKDIDLLREAWDRLAGDVLGPRPERKGPGESAAILRAPGIVDGGRYSYQDLTPGDGAVQAPRAMTADEVREALGANGAWEATAGPSDGGTTASAAGKGE